MELSPYSIYIKKRPVRIAYLLDPKKNADLFDEVFEYNQGKWGGRFNPIILTDGQEIEKSYWDFLKDFDPDFIFSAVALGEDIQKKIKRRLSPFGIEYLPEGYRGISISEYPISILPTKANISAIAQNFPDDEYSIALFNFKEDTPEIIKKFAKRNFGYLETGQMMPYHIKKALEGCKKREFEISDLASLNAALLELGEFHNRIVFPIQLCSLPNNLPDVEWDASNEHFSVIIGDSPYDVAHFWNRSLKISTWLRTKITQLWIPSELADEAAIRSGLVKFINYFAALTGNQGHQGVDFVSFSMKKDELAKITKNIAGEIRHPRSSTVLKELQIPRPNGFRRFFYLRKDMELFRGRSEDEHIILQDPDVQEGGMGGEAWCADLFIEYHPEKFISIQGKSFWWQLPRRNSIISDLRIFNKPGRVNDDNSFSILMHRKSSVHPDENLLTVRLPDDRSIFQSLICGEGFDFIGRDNRERYLSRPFYEVGRSDKGKYLTGILGLFPDLLNAHHLFEDRYWRRMFEIMSQFNLLKDGHSIQTIQEILKKSINHNYDLRSDAGREWLAKRLLNIAKQYSWQEVELEYNQFLEEAQKEHSVFEKEEKRADIPFDPEDLKRRLSDLVALNILLVGVKPRCPKCGYKIWYSIDEANQAIECKGCAYAFSLSAEETWHYRLNSLVRVAVAFHGTIPVLMVLGQLLFDSKSSFIFSSSLDLYKDVGKPELFGELDLVCIEDGDFVIGEIKQSASLFQPEDFEKMKSVAKLIRPDKIIFSSMDEKLDQRIKVQIEQLGKDLAELEIKIEWLQLPYWVFKAHPVR